MLACYAVLDWQDYFGLIDIPCVIVDDGPDDPPEYVRNARAAWELGLSSGAFYIATARGYDAAMTHNLASAYRPEVP